MGKRKYGNNVAMPCARIGYTSIEAGRVGATRSKCVSRTSISASCHLYIYIYIGLMGPQYVPVRLGRAGQALGGDVF